MAVAVKENTTIELPRLAVQMMDVTLIGDTPLIVHAWSLKAKREMLDKQMWCGSTPTCCRRRRF